MSDPRSSSSTPFSRNGRRNRLPGIPRFGCRLGPRTSPIDARDVAEVIAAILVSPTTHIGKVYELTGPRSQNMHGVAAEYSEALGRPITYVDMPFDQWRDQVVRTHNLSDHVSEHFLTMAGLHAANRYDRLTHDVETIIGRPSTNIRDFVARHKEFFDKQVAVA